MQQTAYSKVGKSEMETGQVEIFRPAGKAN